MTAVLALLVVALLAAWMRSAWLARRARRDRDAVRAQVRDLRVRCTVAGVDPDTGERLAPDVDAPTDPLHDWEWERAEQLLGQVFPREENR